MGSLGLPEIAFILVLALLIFGPKKLPEIGRTLGKGVSEFRRATDELKRSINTELALDEAPTPPVLRSRRLEEPVEPIAMAAATEAALPLSTPEERHEVFAAPYEAPDQTQARSGMTSFPQPVPSEAAEPVIAVDITDPAVAAQAANAADLTGAAPAAPALPASPELPEPR
jgi:sec-independent protein translocase protein TatA